MVACDDYSLRGRMLHLARIGVVYPFGGIAVDLFDDDCRLFYLPRGEDEYDRAAPHVPGYLCGDRVAGPRQVFGRPLSVVFHSAKVPFLRFVRLRQALSMKNQRVSHRHTRWSLYRD